MLRAVVGRATGQGPWCQTHPWLSVRSRVRSASRSCSSLCLLLSAGAPARTHMHTGLNEAHTNCAPAYAHASPFSPDRACLCAHGAHLYHGARLQFGPCKNRRRCCPRSVAWLQCCSEDTFEEFAGVGRWDSNAPSPCCERRTSAQPAAGPCRPNLADTHHTPCMVIGALYCRTCRRHKAYID